MKFKLPSTLAVLATLSIFAAAWETWTICNRDRGDTFSATVRKLGEGQTFVIFMLGMLMGHLWWPLIDGED